jgi:hypothetical protein
MNLLYKITFENSLSHFRSVLYYLIAIVVFVLVMTFIFGVSDLRAFIEIGVFFYGFLMVLPTIIIHLNYFFVNKNTEMIIYPEKKSIRFFEKETWKQFGLYEIEKVEVYMSPQLYRKSTGFTPWDSYHYTKLCLKDGKSLFITCLMANEWDIQLNDLPRQIIQSQFPIIFMDRSKKN